MNAAASNPSPRVLAVDDQRDSLRLLQIRLQAAGFHCLGFQDGRAALDFLQREPVDVIILDVMMPGMDGFELCRQLKANERTRDIPILFLTAKMETEDKIRGLEAGGHDYLSKPVEQEELVARTRAAYRTKQLQDQLKEQLLWQQELDRLHQKMLGEHWQKNLGQLAAGLAHEINNPLTVALGSAKLLSLDPTLPAPAQDRLNVIAQSLHRAALRLRSFLLMAQPSREPEEFFMSELLEDLVTLVNHELVMHNIRLEKKWDQDERCRVPRGQAGRALLYVLNNAIEAVAGRPEPRIRTELRREDSTASLHIANNGPPIPENVRHRIFECFFTTKKAPHSGIGLFLAAETVRVLGGELFLKSSSDPGETEFVIRLPILPGPSPPERSTP